MTSFRTVAQAFDHGLILWAELGRWLRIVAQLRDDTPSLPWRARKLLGGAGFMLYKARGALAEALKLIDEDKWAARPEDDGPPPRFTDDTPKEAT